MAAKKSKQRFYVEFKGSFNIAQEIVADSLDDALSKAKSTAIRDVLDPVGDLNDYELRVSGVFESV